MKRKLANSSPAKSSTGSPVPKRNREEGDEALNISNDRWVLQLTGGGIEFLPGVLLVGKSREKEIQWGTLSAEQRRAFQQAMAREWQKWVDFKVFR